MIAPLKRRKFDELIPAVPTSDQYQYYWGTGRDLFSRLLVSVALLVTFSLLYGRTQENSPNSLSSLFLFVCAGLGSLYWMLEPVARASWRNARLRRFPFCGFWQAEVMDAYLSEEVQSKQESIDDRGRLAVNYNTESFFNLELGDRNGYTTTLRVPMRREYKRIDPGQTICMLLLSNDPNLRRLSRLTSDAYMPEIRLWVSDYPYLRRDAFVELTRYMRSRQRDAAQR